MHRSALIAYVLAVGGSATGMIKETFDSLLVKWLLSKIRDVRDFRRLRRRMPYVYRRLITEGGQVRRESNAEYLERLRDEYRKRHVG